MISIQVVIGISVFSRSDHGAGGLVSHSGSTIKSLRARTAKHVSTIPYMTSDFARK